MHLQQWPRLPLHQTLIPLLLRFYTSPESTLSYNWKWNEIICSSPRARRTQIPGQDFVTCTNEETNEATVQDSTQLWLSVYTEEQNEIRQDILQPFQVHELEQSGHKPETALNGHGKCPCSTPYYTWKIGKARSCREPAKTWNQEYNKHFIENLIRLISHRMQQTANFCARPRPAAFIWLWLLTRD